MFRVGKKFRRNLNAGYPSWVTQLYKPLCDAARFRFRSSRRSVMKLSHDGLTVIARRLSINRTTFASDVMIRKDPLRSLRIQFRHPFFYDLFVFAI